MKKALLSFVMLSTLVISSCKKSNLITDQPVEINSAGQQRPGSELTLNCIPNLDKFYNVIWGIQAPSNTCPYYSSNNKFCKLQFTDGTFLTLTFATFNELQNNTPTGGASLSDFSCNSGTGDFLTYLRLRYFDPIGNGAQSDNAYPLYTCSSPSNYPMDFLVNGIVYRTYSNINYFNYPSNGQYLSKQIFRIIF